MEVTNYLLTGMILQVDVVSPWKSTSQNPINTNSRDSPYRMQSFSEVLSFSYEGLQLKPYSWGFGAWGGLGWPAMVDRNANIVQDLKSSKADLSSLAFFL